MNKSTWIVIGVFALLVTGYFATREKQVSVGIQKFEHPTLVAENVSSIEISGPSPVKLEKANGEWTVSAEGKSFPADGQQVMNFVNELNAFKAADLVTERTEKFAEYEVDEAKGTQVSVPPLKIILGKRAKNGGTYVRNAGSNAVFVTTSSVGSQAKVGVTGWRNKSIASGSDAAKITITPANGSPYSLKSENGTWALDSPVPADFRFDANAAQRLASQLSSLRAQSFADSVTQVVPVISFHTEMKDGKSVDVMVSEKQPDGTAQVQTSNGPQVYVVAGFVADQLLKKLDDLRDTTLTQFDPSKATRISISSGGKKTVVEKSDSSWKLVAPANAEFDPQQVQAVLARVRSLKGLKAVTGVSESKSGLKNPKVTVEIAIEGGPSQRIRVGSEAGANELYVDGSADRLVYVMSAGELSAFTANAGATLFKPPPPAPNMGNMQGLEGLPPDIRRQIEAQLRQQQMN